MRSIFSPGLCFVLFLALSAGSSVKAEDQDHLFFEKEVRPLLVEKCGECHGETRHKGQLQLISREAILKGGDNGPALVPGKPEESLIIKAVMYQDDLRMPPKGKLNDRQLEILNRWVKKGAPWPGTDQPKESSSTPFQITGKQKAFWSFPPFHFVALPPVRDRQWVQSPIDSFILSELERKNLQHGPPADKRTLLRRATFDLIGLPPSPSEIKAFLADDSPQAFAKVVDRLLSSPRYGERWGRHWLDVVRYADARDLIQLPPESDFREAWRYRDWVVDSFNQDLPFNEFVRAQVAGDLLPGTPKEGSKNVPFNKEGLIATGMLAIADFVPGDVDKNQMIADYVNDQVDVVGRAFLGLSISCARCHDHKFDPISTRDYYALAGIFFSSRIIPGPVPGNTPLVRVPLLSPLELEKIKNQKKSDDLRRTELEQSLPDALDLEYRELIIQMLRDQMVSYLLAASEFRDKRTGGAKANLDQIGKRLGLQPGFLADWIRILDQIETRSMTRDLRALKEMATGKLEADALKKEALNLQRAFAKSIQENQSEAGKNPALARSLKLHFQADDPRIKTDSMGRILLWPNRSGLAGDAIPTLSATSPVKTTAKREGHSRAVARFDGKSVLESSRSVPPTGSIFIVFQSSDKARAGERLVGWEDADSGKHGLGIMTNPGGTLHAIMRNQGQSGDLVDKILPPGLEMLGISWGQEGTWMRRNGKVSTSKAIQAISSDPKISALKMGGPGSGGSPNFTGDISEIRVYSRQLNESERNQVEKELREKWFLPETPRQTSPDLVSEVFKDWISPTGPFWPKVDERNQRINPEVLKRIKAWQVELNHLKNQKPQEIPQAVVIQEGGPNGTRHEGFHDSPVFIRGDSKKPGPIVPRGFPRILNGESEKPITEGSGRLSLANWLARSDNPLPARVMVNRIWQHHFGEGLVRTPNDFGARGERPTHPELLDDLAMRFVSSGWSIKAMHRLIMLSSTYQQSSAANPVNSSLDPQNQTWSRMNRQRLDAEAIRDSLLALSGRLEETRGGAPFSDLSVPRRTLYLMSARTGANTSDFGRIFDRADPSMIVGERGQSIVAPQALFFLNDPFVSKIARDLARRVIHEAPENKEDRIRFLYGLCFGRNPTEVELKVGKDLLTPVPVSTGEGPPPDPLERYCLLVIATNEFLYID